MNAVGIGVMAMPADFRHAELLRRGRPRHRKYDEFYMKHPSMDTGHRAKIFAPFDALTGFSDALAAQQKLSERGLCRKP